MHTKYVCTNPEEFDEKAKLYKEHQIKIEEAKVDTDANELVITYTYLGPANMNED